MKKIITIIAAVIISANVFAQAPAKMSYQAVIRNTSNTLVTTTTVGMRISIMQGSLNGTVVYVETQSPLTNANGLATIAIGNGTVVSGDFSAIDWSNGTYFIKTETDPNGGTSYDIAGTSQLMSVPYALYAKTSGSSIPGPQGATGPQGEIGFTGPTGPQGPGGARGPQGPIGLTGATGLQGPQGAIGLTGATGAQGPQGPAGTDGATGPQGTTGPQGLKGNDGEVGGQGPQGPAGSDGATGPQGPIGLTGATGAQGPQGNAGNDGATGPQGPAGNDGANGMDGAQGQTGFLQSGSTAGNTPYWDGSNWVTTTSNIFNSGGNVGIGTATPGAQLDVNGNANVSGNLDATSFIVLGGTNAQFLKADGSVDTNTYLTTAQQGATTLAPIDTNPNTKGATLNGITLSLEPASTSFGGVVTTGAQSLAGAKHFVDSLTTEGTLTVGNGFSGNGRVNIISNNNNFTNPIGVQLNIGSYVKTFTGAADTTLPFYSVADIDASYLGNGNNVTFTDATALHLRSPWGGGFTNGWALTTDGSVKVNGNINTSGTLTIGSVTYPNSDGGSGQVLTTNGNGTPSWQTLPTISGPTGPQGPTGLLTSGTATGVTPYWDGSSWVVSSTNVYNNGTSIAIGTTTPDASAKLDVSSTTQLFLPPRMTTAQRDAISSPASGGILYNTTTKKLQSYVAAVSPSVDGTGTDGTWALWDGPAQGQTIQPLSTGTLISVVAQVAIRASTGDIQAKVYNSVNGTLIATSDNTVTAPWAGSEFNFVPGTWTFNGAALTLNSGTTYYIEFTATNGNRFFIGSSQSYPRGDIYTGNPGSVSIHSGYDIDFIVNYGGSSASWNDLY